MKISRYNADEISKLFFTAKLTASEVKIFADIESIFQLVYITPLAPASIKDLGNPEKFGALI